MNNLTELTSTELQATNGGGWWNDLIDILEDWLACDPGTGDNCPS